MMRACLPGQCRVPAGTECDCLMPDEWPFRAEIQATIMDRAELQRRQDILVAEGRAIK